MSGITEDPALKVIRETHPAPLKTISPGGEFTWSPHETRLRVETGDIIPVYQGKATISPVFALPMYKDPVKGVWMADQGRLVSREEWLAMWKPSTQDLEWTGASVLSVDLSNPFGFTRVITYTCEFQAGSTIKLFGSNDGVHYAEIASNVEADGNYRRQIADTVFARVTGTAPGGAFVNKLHILSRASI